MDTIQRITVNPTICNGVPTIRGMRIPVQTILGYLLAGENAEEILFQYPSLELADIEACKEFALRMSQNIYSIFPTAA
jgi:uncharacterized protein (DUF433 family)